MEITLIVDATPDKDTPFSPTFRRRQEFIKALASQFDVGPNKTQIAMVSFSHYPKQEFGLMTHSSRHAVVNAINTLTPRTGESNMADAIRFSADFSFHPESGARRYIPKVGIVITHGQSNNMDATIKEATKAEEANIHMMSVGLGKAVNHDELNEIGTNKTDSFRVNLHSFRSIRMAITKMKRKICSLKGIHYLRFFYVGIFMYFPD